MPANLENSAVENQDGKGRFSSQFQRKAMPKNVQIPHNCMHLTSKVMLKNFQTRLQQFMNWEIPDIQAGFRKGRGTRDQIPKSVGSSKKQDNSRTTSTSVSFTTLKPLTMDHNKLWNILKEMGIPDHFTSCKTCMQDKKQQKQTWNNILVPNWERSTSLYIITLRI